MVLREHYLQKVREFYDSDLIKIITGIRRSGKSILLQQIMQEISAKTDNIISLNFEDKRILSNIANGNALVNYIEKHRKSGKCYLFFDEIQVLDGWQDACKTLRLYDNSVFITGSNSKLLSSEFARELSGRYVSFRVRPFVYKEILSYAKELNKTVSITDYLVWGGFPNRFEFVTLDAQQRYLEDLNETIIINDLVHRYKIRKITLFKNLVNFVLRSNGRIITVNSIINYLKKEHITCTSNTIMKYLSYLVDAYIIDTIKQYTTKTKNELGFKVKIYDTDVSLNSIRCNNNRYDLMHNLENVVYNELRYMGYKLFVYDNNGKEIDFLAQKGNKRYFIQVAYSVVEEKAYEREFGAFKGLDELAKKILITVDDIDFSTSVVRHIKLKDFLLMNSLEDCAI